MLLFVFDGCQPDGHAAKLSDDEIAEARLRADSGLAGALPHG
jgi:hypothetical protein